MGVGDLGGEMVDEGAVADVGGFCEGKFWDLSLTWETDDPDFTACFHQTALTYAPLAVLLLLLPVQLSSLRQSGTVALPWTILLGTKAVLSALLVPLPIIGLGWLLASPDAPSAPVHMVASAVRVFTYTLALTLLLLCKRRGQITSGPLFIFWFLEAVL